MCIHEPCSCPHLGCDFVASSKQLYMHSYRAHTYSAISFSYDSTFSVPVTNGMEYAVLRESTDKTLFVLNYAVQSIGNVASITCISPSSVKKGFSYELVAQKRDSKIKLESFTECMPRWSKYVPHGEFLLVPSDFLESQFLLVRIQKGAQWKPWEEWLSGTIMWKCVIDLAFSLFAVRWKQEKIGEVSVIACILKFWLSVLTYRLDYLLHSKISCNLFCSPFTSRTHATLWNRNEWAFN